MGNGKMANADQQARPGDRILSVNGNGQPRDRGAAQERDQPGARDSPRDERGSEQLGLNLAEHDRPSMYGAQPQKNKVFLQRAIRDCRMPTNSVYLKTFQYASRIPLAGL